MVMSFMALFFECAPLSKGDAKALKVIGHFF
jgi:hypothetical protein